MEKAAELGHNRTGTQLSPELTNEQLDAAKNNAPDVPGDAGTLALARQEASQQADRIGSVPVPGSTKGKLKSGFDKLLGHQPELLVDKLGERLAFERTGVRLYDAMIAKVASRGEDQHNIGEQLRKIRDEELAHMKLVKASIEILGADPTAMTPCANVVAVSASGIMQVLTDPRTNISQCLNALLTLELTDNAAWELLVDLTKKAGHPHISKDFEHALQQEDSHLLIVKEMLKRELEVQA